MIKINKLRLLNLDNSITNIVLFLLLSKVGDHSRGWTEGSIFNSYYTEV